ncbi:MAG: Ig-like domain-containing protein, partial [Bacteroidales bacterium]|nr:Ig-like domain-containing protein [Bacteroidales bacterium]
MKIVLRKTDELIHKRRLFRVLFLSSLFLLISVKGWGQDAPVVTGISDQTIAEGSAFATIALDDYVSDIDNTDAEMVWTWSGNTALTVSIVSRVATITTPGADWNGAETITFRATDPGALYDEDAATFTVTVDNDAPVVTVIPDQTIAEGSSFATIALDDYVSDIDNTDAEMVWSYSGNTALTVSIVSRVATITTPGADWNGAETITFTATDPGLLSGSNPATFTVTVDNDAPVVTDIPDQTIAEGSSFTTIALDDYVSDIDNTDAEMVWSYSG